jgi:hypothetical protein
MDVIVLEYWCRECWLREGEISCSSSPLNRSTRCSYIGKNGEETRKKKKIKKEGHFWVNKFLFLFVRNYRMRLCSHLCCQF